MDTQKQVQVYFNVHSVSMVSTHSETVSHSKQHGCFLFQVCMCVEAPETQNNTPNPRKRDFFIIWAL